MIPESVPYNYENASETDQFAIRTYHRSAIRFPRFLVDTLGWEPGRYYSVSRHDGHHIVRYVGDDGDTQFSKKKNGHDDRVDGYELYLSHDDVPWRQGDKLVLETYKGHLRLRDATDDDYDRVHQDAVRRMGRYHASGETVFDLYEDRTDFDVTDHINASSFTNVWFTDEWFFGDVTFSNRDRDGFSIPAPLFLPTFFETGETYGVASADDGVWYLCPPADGDFTAIFYRRDNIGLRLATRSFPGFENGDRLHLMYDPDGDTLVIYSMDASPFPDPHTRDGHDALQTTQPYSRMTASESN